MSAVEERVAEKRHLKETETNSENGVANKEQKLENGAAAEAVDKVAALKEKLKKDDKHADEEDADDVEGDEGNELSSGDDVDSLGDEDDLDDEDGDEVEGDGLSGSEEGESDDVAGDDDPEVVDPDDADGDSEQ